MSYTIQKYEYVTGMAEEVKPADLELTESVPANHPTLASARSALDEIANSYYFTELEFEGADMLWVYFKWDESTALRAYGMPHIRTRVVYFITKD